MRAEALSRLDEESRRSLSRLGWKLAVIIGAAAAFAMRDPQPLAKLAAMLEALSYLASMISVVAAAISRQQMKLQSFTRWDEALALGAVSLAAHIGRGLLG